MNKVYEGCEYNTAMISGHLADLTNLLTDSITAMVADEDEVEIKVYACGKTFTRITVDYDGDNDVVDEVVVTYTETSDDYLVYSFERKLDELNVPELIGIYEFLKNL